LRIWGREAARYPGGAARPLPAWRQGSHKTSQDSALDVGRDPGGHRLDLFEWGGGRDLTAMKRLQ